MPLLEELNYVPTEKYAHAKELLEHADRIGRHWNLYDRAFFQTEVYEVRWDDQTALWTAKSDRGDTIRCHYLVPAAGPLHRPKLPGVPGITTFKGHTMHSSRWDYNYSGGGNLGSLEKLKDKRVGIIGTGATAVQIVPHLGKSAKEVYVFQRTPSSIDVRGNHPTSPEWAASLKPGWQKHRMNNFNAIVHGEILEEDLVKDGWTDILQKLLARMTPDMDFKKIEAERQLADFEKMEEIRARCDALVKDPVTAANLKPWYNQLCKRPCFHDQYLQTFNLPSVHLIHTDGKGVEAITPKGIIANGKEYELDCIVYATGFEVRGTGNLPLAYSSLTPTATARHRVVPQNRHGDLRPRRRHSKPHFPPHHLSLVQRPPLTTPTTNQHATDYRKMAQRHPHPPRLDDSRLPQRLLAANRPSCPLPELPARNRRTSRAHGLRHLRDATSGIPHHRAHRGRGRGVGADHRGAVGVAAALPRGVYAGLLQ